MNQHSQEELIAIKQEHKNWIRQIEGCTGISVGLHPQNDSICLKVYHSGDMPEKSQKEIKDKLVDLGEQLLIEYLAPSVQQQSFEEE